jgi:D-beta-D-heptose 7-phosphate kinase/D-beta-D-heptose 1-phosphate adenosyltransferase
MAKLVTNTDKKVIAISGGFDPIHVGHVRMIQSAAELGEVVVILNTDAWLLRKKGYTFMKWQERAEILKAINGVTIVVPAKDYDGSVCESLIDLKDVLGLSYFGNGGDRKKVNTPEINVCDKLGIQLVWNLGGGKVQSSSDLVRKFKKVQNKENENGKGRS